MTMLIVVLHVFVCLFLIAVILLQAGRGQGLSWGVFGGTPQSILGTKTASFLSRVTTICASVFLLTCIALNVIETRKSRSLFAPTKTSQIDLAKIKQALEEAQQKPSETTPQAAPEKPADVVADAVVKEVTEPETKTVDSVPQNSEP
jgi:preprotein translocase subunit SecG